MGARPRFVAAVKRLSAINCSAEEISSILKVSATTVVHVLLNQEYEFSSLGRDVWYKEWLVAFLQGHNVKRIIAKYPGVDEIDFWSAYYAYFKNRNSAWIGEVRRLHEGAPITWEPGVGLTRDEWQQAIQKYTYATKSALKAYLAVPQEDHDKFLFEARHWSYWREFNNDEYLEDRQIIHKYKNQISPAVIYSHIFNVDKLEEIAIETGHTLNELVDCIMKYPSLYTLCVDLNLITQNGSVVRKPDAKQLNIYHCHMSGYGTELIREMFKCSKNAVAAAIETVERHRINRGVVKRKYYENCDR
jgi:hypothetical protein